MAIFQTQGPKSFGGGEALSSLAGNINDETQQRLKNKLQLALESTRIENEQKAKQAQAAFEFQQQAIPGGAAGAYLGAVGIPQEGQQAVANQGPIQPNVLDTLIKGGAAMSASKAKGQKPLRDHYTDEKGMIHQTFSDAQGNPISDRVLGRDKWSSKQLVTAKSFYLEGQKTLDDLNSDFLKAFGAKDVSGLPAQYLDAKLSTFKQGTPQGLAVKLYLDRKQAAAQRLEKKLTGVGRITEAMLEGFSRELPGPDDTVGEAMLKNEAAVRLFKNARDAEFEAVGIKPEEPKTTKAAPVNSNDPLGIR